MSKDQLDVMLENYFEEINVGADPVSIKEGATAIYKEGISEIGLLRLIEGELGKEKSQEVAAVLSNDENKDSEPVSGVGGWLALFCMALIVFSPARNIITLLNSFDSQMTITTEDVVFITIVAVFTIFSIVAGIALLTRKSYAVRLAKIYLVSYLMVNVVIPASLLLLDMPKEYSDSILSSPFRTLVAPVIFFLIWFSYLSTSLRVKNTYY